MSNQYAHITGIANVTVGGYVNNSNIVITVLGKSADYHQLIRLKGALEGQLSYVPVDNSAKRLELQNEIGVVEQEINSFMQNVLALAEQFSRIRIDTERLARANMLFESGSIREANDTLNEIELEIDSQLLLNSLLGKEQEIDEIKKKQKHIAEEYLLKGNLSRVDYSLSNRWKATEMYYRKSLSILHFKENVWTYGAFLAQEERWKEASPYFEEFLNNFNHSSIERKIVLYSLATCLHHVDRRNEAVEYFDASNSIQINSSSSASCHRHYEADAYHNKAVALLDDQQNEQAIQSLDQALAIRDQVIGQYPGTSAIAWKIWTLIAKISAYLQMGERTLAFSTFKNTTGVAINYFVSPIFYDPRYFPTQIIEHLTSHFASLHNEFESEEEQGIYYLELMRMAIKLDELVNESGDNDATETMVRTFVRLYESDNKTRIWERYERFSLQYDKIRDIRQSNRITLSNTQVYAHICLRLAQMLAFANIHDEAKGIIAEGKRAIKNYNNDNYLLEIECAFDSLLNDINVK